MEQDRQTKYNQLVDALKPILQGDHPNLDIDAFIDHGVSMLSLEDAAEDALIEFSTYANRKYVQLNQVDKGTALLENLKSTFQAQDKINIVLRVEAEIVPNLFRLGKTDEALELNTHILDRAKTMDDPAFIADAYHSQGVLLHLSGDLDGAEEMYLHAYQLLDEIPDYETQNQYLYSLANLYLHYKGDFVKAKEFYQKALQLAITEDNDDKISFYYDHIGMAEYWLEDYKASLDAHAKSWKILEDRTGAIEVLFHKVSNAATHVKMKNYKAALADLSSVLELKKENTDTYSNSLFLLTLAEIIDSTDLDVSAFESSIDTELTPGKLAEKAKQLGIDNKHPPSIVHADLFLAKLTFDQRPEDAIPLLSEAKQVAISSNRRRELASVAQFADSVGLDISTI